jgi:3-oxoacyl-[acyl-carrier protein] reductase
MELSGKISLVTGGTRGIGAATAMALARSGSDVALVARRMDEQAEKTKQAIVQLNRRCLLIQADCGVTDQVQQVVEQTTKELGAADVLVHSAGGPVSGGLLEITPEAWHRAFDVHVHAVYYLARAVVPAMRRKKEGAIVLISSTAGIRGVISNIAYQVAKGALPQFTRALAREFADDNIRINCVAPGVVRTEFHATMSEEQRKLNLEKRIPLHREGKPEDVADLVLGLIRNEYITGETMVIDGGLTMRIA